MGISEFDDAWDDEGDGSLAREARRLGEGILGSAVRALEPRTPVCVSESASIREAITLMVEQEIGALLVEREGRAVGIFTERDVLRRVVLRGLDQARPVSEVMTRDPETLRLEDGIAFALNRMIVGGFRHVPIVDEGGRPQAVLSLREVVAFITELLPGRVLNLPPDPRLQAHSEDGG
ncbi:MAG TPA: CBS domain-containing protein [Vicinamibacteria bacterium]